MSLDLIQGSLNGTTQVGTWGQIVALTDSDIYIETSNGNARFSLSKGSTFGGLSLSGVPPFPNIITKVTVYGQGEIIALTTAASGGGGGAGATGMVLSGSFLNLLSGSAVLSSVQIYPATTASFALTASYIDITGSGVLVNWNGSQLQLTGSAGIDTGSLLYTSSLVAGPGITITQSGSQYVISGSEASSSNYFDLVELGKNTNPNPSSSGNWRLITSASNLNFEYWDGTQWVVDSYMDGTPYSGSGGNILYSSSLVAGTNITITPSGSQLVISSTGGGGDLQTTTTLGNFTSQSVDINDGSVPSGTSNTTGSYTLTVGRTVVASGVGSVAFNDQTHALGAYSHAEGERTTAQGDYSHAEGERTTASGYASHTEGYQTTISSNYSHTEGTQTVAIAESSHAEGYQTIAAGDYSHVEGNNSTSKGYTSHAEGEVTTALAKSSHTEGERTVTSGISSHAEGQETTTFGYASHAEGYLTTAVSQYSHAEGERTTTLGVASHAEGAYTTAVGDYSHAEGGNAMFVIPGGLAIGIGSHAEGQQTTSPGESSHAEGLATISDGIWSHAEGQNTTAIGQSSHSEGYRTTAVGFASHTEGEGTIASIDYQHVQGMWNLEMPVTGAFIIGNGTDPGSLGTRSNLLYAFGNQVQITGSGFILSGSKNGQIITNGGDTFTSAAPAMNIVTLTSAEYTAIIVKDPNTIYVVI